MNLADVGKLSLPQQPRRDSLRHRHNQLAKMKASRGFDEFTVVMPECIIPVNVDTRTELSSIAIARHSECPISKTTPQL